MVERTESGRQVTITRNQLLFVDWMTDVLIYIIVLNLFVEYWDAIVIDSFTISILTAVLLKAMLDVIAGVEHRVAGFFRAREGAIYTVLGAISVFSILFLSKLLILEIVDLVFGDHVELGHFVEVIVLIVSMIVARKLVGVIYRSLGDPQAEPAAAHGAMPRGRTGSCIHYRHGLYDAAAHLPTRAGPGRARRCLFPPLPRDGPRGLG